jgi:nucleoside-diphosphate-sugar epimerase
MRVLVTGATSLLGGSIARALAERGDEVVCLQRRPMSSAATVSAAAGSATDAAGATVGSITEVLGDVRDLVTVARAAEGCDGVIHLAAKVGVVGEWEEYRSINVDGTAAVLEAVRRAGVGRLVHVSSPSVAHGGEPITGDAAEAPVLGRRRAWYPESKAIAEQLVLDAELPGIGVVVVRPHLVWGPGDTQLVGRIVERARTGRLALVGSGAALVDTLYLDNAVDGHLAALDAVAPGAACDRRAYVLTNAEPRPIRELVAGICAAAGVPFAPRTVAPPVARAAGSLVERVWPLLRRDDEPPLTRFLAEQLGTAHWFDPEPARRDLGYIPRVSVDEGLARLAAWFATTAGVRHAAG